jgi:hypothetical protein
LALRGVMVWIGRSLLVAFSASAANRNCGTLNGEDADEKKRCQRSCSLPALHNQGFRVVFSLGVDSLDLAGGFLCVTDYHDGGMVH